MYDRDRKIPMWVGGVLLALLLIVLTNRGANAPNSAVLIQRFVPQPTDPSAPTAQPFELPQIHLPSLPPAC